MPTASGSIAYLGAARFQGYWNATTNEATGSGLAEAASGPFTTLFSASSPSTGYSSSSNITASAGDYWQVTGAGTFTVDGSTDWSLNDWCIYSASAGGSGTWKKLAFEDTIASIIMGDLSSSSFHMGAENDQHIIFNSGTVHTGSDNLKYDYTNGRLLIDSDITYAKLDTVIRTSGGSNFAMIRDANYRLLDSSRFTFGTGFDSHMLYNGTSNFLIISGSATGGTVLSGSVISASCDGFAIYNPHEGGKARLDFISDQGDDAEDGSTSITYDGSDSGGVNTGLVVQSDCDMTLDIGTGAEKRLYFANAGTLRGSLDLDGSGEVRFVDSADATVFVLQADALEMQDDKKLQFGSSGESFIMYRETSDNYMVISGSTAGLVLSGNLVYIDAHNGVGIGDPAPKTAFSVVHNYDSGSAGTKFEDQLSDNEGGGKILKYGAGTLTAGQLYYLGSDSNWAQVDADAVASGASQLLGIAMGTSPTSNGLLLAGFFKVASGNVEGTAVVGAAVYASEEPGKFDFTAPSASNDFVRVVGYCVDIDSSDILLYFNPDSTFVEIA